MTHFRETVNKALANTILLILTCIMVSSCGKDDPEPQYPTEKRKTIIVYMMAENSMSDTDRYHDNLPYTEVDIKEMRKAINDIPKDCNFVIYIDDVKYPRIEVLTENNPEHVETLPEHDSADPEQFASNIKRIIEQYPAKSYGMVLWSHGSGWIPAHYRKSSIFRNRAKNYAPAQKRKNIGIDNLKNTLVNDGSSLEIADLNEQLNKIGVHLDYILFDACFMQCIEVAYELRKVTDYIIASPAEIPGEGAPYDEIMKGLCMDGQNAAEEITNKYYKYHKELSEKSSFMGSNGVVISYIKTDELDNLLAITRSILPNFYEQAYTVDTRRIQEYCTYYWYQNPDQPEFHDMGSAMQKIMSGPEYERWRGQLNRTIPNISFTKGWNAFFCANPTITDPDYIAACSIFIPNTKYDSSTILNESIKNTQWYKDFNAE